MLKHVHSYLDFVNEGVKIGPEGQVVLSRKDEVGDVLSFTKGKVKKTGVGPYSVHYRLETPSQTEFSKETIKLTMNKLKSGELKNVQEEITSFIKPDLLELANESGAYSGYDYIIQVGSSEGLAKIMTDAALKTFPKAKVINLPKIVHSTYYTAVNYPVLQETLKMGKDSSFKLVHKFIFTQIDKTNTSPEIISQYKAISSVDDLNSFLKNDYENKLIKWKEGHTDFKIKKSEKIPGNIIRFFRKYDFENAEFLEAVEECSNPAKNKYALILDDNIHNGTDTTNIFKFIDSIIKDSAKNLSALRLSGLLSDSDYYRLVAKPYYKHFTAYVLYRIKDIDLPKDK